MIKTKSQNAREKGGWDYQEEDEVRVFNLQRMKDGFLLEQSCRGSSKATVEYYRGNIDRFVNYMKTDTIVY